MKTFKLTDLIIQWVMLAAGLTYWAFDKGPGFLAPYFLVGGWQFLSYFTHIFIRLSWVEQKNRDHYGRALVWLIAIGLICFLLSYLSESPVILLYLMALLVITPVYACFYFWIGMREWENIKKKELIHLK